MNIDSSFGLSLFHLSSFDFHQIPKSSPLVRKKVKPIENSAYHGAGNVRGHSLEKGETGRVGR